MPSDLSLLHKFKARMEPIIEEEDLRELEHIDPHRAWRSEAEFQVGKRWTLTGYQFRRSLALYAQRSGLVSLPSLRRQLQHITEELSLYYANGSAFAKDFVGNDKEHFAYEWRDTGPESEALKYLFDLLFSNKKFIGGHAHFIKHRKTDENGVIQINREEVMRQVKNGEFSYTETLIGGCTKTGLCDRPALDWLNIWCVKRNCANMMCDVVKLDRVITSQEKMVAGMKKKDDEYRTEVADLKALKDFKAKHQPRE